MTKKMLIDATHAEETRVAVVDGQRLVEFDYESKVRKQLKSSIFLAKVTRVEPSLQAAFVNFGGNRHGFLPFSEIHTDYYRIPIADREALLAEQHAEMEARRRAEEEADREEDERQGAHDDHAEDDEVTEVGGENEVAEDEREPDGGTPEDDAAADTRHYAAARSPRAVIYAPEEAGDQEDQNAVPSLPADDAGHEAQSQAGQDDADDMAAGSYASFRENAADMTGAAVDEDGMDADMHAGEGQPEGEPDSDHQGAVTGRRHYRGRDRGRGKGRGRGRMRGGRGRYDDRDHVESLGGDTDGEYVSRPSSRRHYKIQEVVKRGQIMLVQVSKEERGNKGAAVTTYLSLPGRYCVLMPNSPRGGGVSRKIASFQERRRMRELLSELEVPQGMSVIMRTAGVTRTKVEIKRDLDYLMRLWDEIRETTLQSSAPAPIHEEGNLVRRSIRDIYTSEIEEVLVAGDEGYKFARDFMKMMIPSHAKRVKQYRDERVPLFNRYQIESQISEMGEPSVTLKSGGYIVINPTEALVSIDVNSGRATKERHIEETALKTNLEAAEEVARQLRLRDLGGLIVIDFIDMEDRRNNRRVEERLKQALSSDRARIQVGRISSFGLLELSRQRLNPSLTEAQFEKCAHCQGVGVVRTTDSAAIFALRALEEEGARSRAGEVILSISSTVALYILNNKRDMLNDLERRYGFRVIVQVDEEAGAGGYKVEAVKGTSPIIREDHGLPGQDAAGDEDFEDTDLDNTEGEDDSLPEAGRDEEPNPSHESDESRQNGRRRGRRGGRRRRGGARDFASGQPAVSGPGDEQPDYHFESEGKVLHDQPAFDANAGQPSAEDVHSDEHRDDRKRNGRNRRRGRFNRSGPRDDRAAVHEGPYSASSEKAFSEEADARNAAEPAVERQVPLQPVDIEPVVSASNDHAMLLRDYERVNEEPMAKKRGWWSKIKDGG